MGDTGAMDDIVERAKRIYRERIEPELSPEDVGRIVSIEVDSGDWEIATDGVDDIDVVRRLRARHSNPRIFAIRVGYRAFATIGGVNRRLKPGERV